MRKEDVLKTIFKCADEYEKNLADRNFFHIHLCKFRDENKYAGSCFWQR